MKRIKKEEGWWYQEVKKPGNELIAILEYPPLDFPGSNPGSIGELCPMIFTLNDRAPLWKERFPGEFPPDHEIEAVSSSQIIPVEISGGQNIGSLIRSGFINRKFGKNAGLLTLPEIEFVLGTEWIKPLEEDGCGDRHFFTNIPVPFWGCDIAQIKIETSVTRPAGLFFSTEAANHRTQLHDFIFLRKV